MTHSKKDSHKQGKATGSHTKVTRPVATDARSAALYVLADVLEQGTDVQAALDICLGSASMHPADRGLCTELVYGTLRQKIRLEWFVRRFLKKADQLPKEMLLALEMAAYALFFLRVPDHATLNWTVDYVKKLFGQSLAGVTNGTLRSLQREQAVFADEATYSKECGDEGQALACRYSMPLWMVRLWLKAYGHESTKAYLEASSRPAPVGVRINKAAPEAQALYEQLAPSALQSNGYGLAFTGKVPEAAELAIRDGRAVRQSLASYETLMALSPATWPQPIWDCCAGRGGKTLALVEEGIGVALASDISEYRLAGYRCEVERLGLTGAPASLNWSAIDEGPFPDSTKDGSIISDSFGTVFIDAPCSGFGTLARRPEIRFRRTLEDCKDLVQLQANILDAVVKRIRPGGMLVYITCTLNPAENEEQVAAFIDRHAGSKVRTRYHTPATSPLGEFFFGVCIELASE